MQSIITIEKVSKYYDEGGSAGAVIARGPVRGLRRHRNSMHALKDINLTIRAGEFFVIVGPSGSGKSTLIRLMTRLETPSSGKIEYAAGVDEHDIGFVFQQFALLPWLSVAENIELNLIGRKVPLARRKQIVAAQLREFGLEKFADAKPRELSGGMKQRVGLARAFAADAPIIFLDEPFSELDIFTSEELRGELLRMWQGNAAASASSANSATAPHSRKTIVMVSHNVSEAIELADRIAVLSSRPGEIKAILDNHLPRPRASRTPEFFAMEDKLRDLLKQ